MLRAVFLSLALALSVFGEDYAFVKPGEFWHVTPYLTNAAPEPRSNWTELNYDDSTWALLRASFVRSGIGSPGTAEQTFLAPGPNTFVFRKTFQIADPKFVEWLTLRVDYESGFVAYLNGLEIVRRGFPVTAESVPLDSSAQFHPRGPTEQIDISAYAALLRPGTNVLAIQLHSAGTNYPGMLLVPELLANFARGPFIQNTTTNSTYLIWQTAQPTTGFVVYGKDADHLSVAGVAENSTNHVAILTNLESGQTYLYRVYAQDGAQVAATDWFTFRTLKMPDNPITFLVVGDTGQGLAAQHKIAEQMRAQNADLFFHVGDVLYPCFTAAAADARCFSIYREQMRSSPLFVAMGNHDGYCSAPDYFNAFYLPTNTVSNTEHWYSFDHGDAHFIALATETPIGNRYEPGSPQYNWLEADLVATKQKWKFIFFHHVFRSSSLHSYDDYWPFNGWDRFDLQTYIGGLASRYGAQVIFNGHDHDYERFAAMDGVNSFVSGGGGATLYGQAYPEEGFSEGSAQFHSRQNFLRVTVNGPEMVIEAVDDNGIVFDRFFRSQNASGAGPFTSKWASPNVEPAMGSDVAGNIVGQTFDFAGESLPTRAGVRGNLGRLYVRNDQNLLYVGFETASIWRNQAIALFLENPARPGITELAPLGNGLIDNEDGEGADGLDLLTKLSFRNFRPSIACLLGDERVDYNERSYQRLHMRWPVGQGVFHLDQTFSAVPRARLQQFNRSPQTPAPVYFDANADFIEVAIPLYELGNPQLAGGQVKLGAIVFSDPASGPLEPQIDTAFAAAALEPGAEGSFTLEPLTIQLAPDPDPGHDGFAFSATIVADKLHFEWNSVAPAVYTIEASPALGQAFAPLNVPGLPITSTGPRTSFDLTIDGSSPRFYRLRAN
jgi:hypothetical protein